MLLGAVLVFMIEVNLFTIFTSANEHRQAKAKKFYDDAFNFIRQNDNSRALASFRTAVRLDNSSYLYWNDLGVTEMRLGQLQKAYERFQRAYALRPDFEVTQKNINDLEDYLSTNPNITEKRIKEIKQPSPHYKTYPKNQRHGIKPLPTYTAEEFSELLLNLQSDDQYLQLLSKPFLIRNYVNINQNQLNYISFSSLQSNYENVRIDFYPHNMLQEQTHPFFKPIDQAFEQFIEPSEAYVNVDISLPGSYIQWNLLPKHFRKILKDLNISLPYLFEDDFLLEENPNCLKSHRETLLPLFYLNTHWKMFLIGEEGAGMFNHQDTLLSPTWQLLLTGIKQWHLCSNSQTAYLYKPGDVNLFHPNYEDYPNILKIKCFQFNQTKGDLLYYPGNYWHQTMNFETPTIGMTGTFITKASVKELIRELRKECDGANRLFAKDQVLCSQLSTCFQSWQDILSTAGLFEERIIKKNWRKEQRKDDKGHSQEL